MRGKDIFTEEEANEIRELLIKKVVSSTKEQKIIRGRLRKKYKFYIRDFSDKSGFTIDDFNELVQTKRITIIR